MSDLIWLIGLPLAGAAVILLVRRWALIAGPLAGATLIAGGVLAAGAASAEPLEILGQTLALSQAASQSLTYAYALVGAACIVSSRRGHDGLLYGIVLASAALASAALAASGIEIMAYGGAGALLALALAAPLAGTTPRLQSIHAVSVMALLPLLLIAPFWLLESQQVAPASEATLQTASVLAVVAGALLLGLFPLHLWRSAVQTTGHPALTMAAMTWGSLVGLCYLGRLLQTPAWPRFWSLARPLLLYGGALTALLGGVMSTVHTHRRQVLGHASLAYWGGTIVHLAQALPDSSPSVSLDLWLGAIALLTATCALWCLRDDEDAVTPLPTTGRAGRIVCLIALTTGVYALSGLPPAASFPVRFAGSFEAAGEDALLGYAMLIGAIGVAWGGIGMVRARRSDPIGESKHSLSTLLPSITAMVLTIILWTMFVFPALLRALPAAWLPDLLALYETLSAVR